MSCNLEGNLEVNSKMGIILPTYCEAQNIEKLVAEIEALPLNTSILVIDDSSPDGTADAVRQLQTKHTNLLLLVRPQKSGLGSAITDGFRSFLSLRTVPEFVVTMDADYSHNPADLPRLVSSVVDGCDLAIGSRYCKGGKIEGWPLARKVISRGANAIARGILGLKLHDCTSGFRCYSTRLVKKTIRYLHSQTYDIQIETVKQAHSQGFKIKEVPILFVNRKSGKSKLTLVEIENYLSYIFKTLLMPTKPENAF
ncbi:MAG: polyprenol monophosphomannose synthase [Candidatus Bathyarchaeota archaeon]|nr:polyprenol monophosphomannose synthase [Candidatus Bathyarchaeota archaeon]